VLVCLIVFVLIINPTPNYEIGDMSIPPVVLEYQEDQLNRKELEQKYGKNKTLLPGFELPILVALSHYPELENIPIEFRTSRGFRSATARVDVLSLLLPWRDHVYVVYISDADTSDFSGKSVKDWSFNNQVAVFAHELGHIIEYVNKSSLHIAGVAIRYVFGHKFVRKFELIADNHVRERNLAYIHLQWLKDRKSLALPGSKLHENLGDLYGLPEDTQEYINAHSEQYDL